MTRPRLSASIAHRLTTESPLAAWAAHRLLGNLGKPPTASQIEGRMWHAAILGESHDLVIVDADDFRTAAAREMRDAILAEGRIPVAAAKMDGLAAGAARIRTEMARFGILIDGAVELRREWAEVTEGGEVVGCSGVLDHYNGRVIHDLKTGSSMVTPRDAARSLATSHALLQDAAYRRAVVETDGVDFERIEVVFVFVQTEEPYAVTPVTMAGDFRELSHLRWRRAIEDWHACLSKGAERQHWPGPAQSIMPVSAPGWMISQELELEVMRDE